MAVVDWDTVNQAGLEQTIHLLSTNHDYMVRAAVQNNPTAVKAALGITDRIDMASLVDLVLALDAEEQHTALDVPYLEGKNAVMDMAFGTMAEELRTKGLLGDSSEGGPQKFVLAALGLASVASAFFANQTAQKQADAAATAADQAARDQAAARAIERAATQHRMDAIKKAVPWMIVILVILALIIAKALQP